MIFVSNIVQVVIFAFFTLENQYKVLLLKRTPEEEVYPNLWQICTGTSEEGETALQTAKREIAEETGIVHFKKLWSVPKVPSYYSIRQEAICFSPVFAIEVGESEKIQISEEHTEFGWFTFEEAKAKTFVPSYHESMQYVWDYIIKSEMPDIFLIKDK